MKRKVFSVIVCAVAAAAVIILAGCAVRPLSSWNGGAPGKTALIDYVSAVTDPGSPDYIPVENRVAVFDFDGTLFLETSPTYFDWQLFEHRVLDDPTCRATEEQLAAARASRNGKFPPLDQNRERMVAEAYRGMTVDEFGAFVRKFMAEEQPGFVGLKRGDAYYRPMLEVIDYLRQNGFTVYVISGTERFTMRVLTGRLRLPPSQVIGSDNTVAASGQGDRESLRYVFVKGDRLLLGGKNLVKNLQMNKVSVIVREIGIQPVLAFGNAMSDASMLNYAISGNRYKALAFMLLCDDLKREYGNLAKAGKMRRACAEYGWIPVSMRDDWKTIYGDGVRKGSGK
ncbi:MAG: haloacid dehalogenase-like hydrolase [Lentisphaeria bacterium]|nr:haloacid dehalogenase-like hydrolase [Lentisphaeria bacterium]